MEEAVRELRGKILTGQVISVRPKTIVVRVARSYKIPKYGVTKTRYKKCHAHDELNSAAVGDTVSILSSRPRSALKRWVLLPPDYRKQKLSK
ncbi:small ribosomal subunit protein uS17 [Candidatus Mycoplasma haematominutum]|uniref:Ribosomal protein S17 n=1 Tax=Candidatus Mycoplasma haematominutum 'Birmingham 1' TaxID=1116213 RepID=G8C324_9MOLU|nr:uS17 family ribosomal protein [Candidatus Mycoplasma haematominutum]CCE66722.1 ribosomal protein S17 [Candidatus Mycoplasma haematominutum 'Birmingham 1']